VRSNHLPCRRPGRHDHEAAAAAAESSSKTSAATTTFSAASPTSAVGALSGTATAAALETRLVDLFARFGVEAVGDSTGDEIDPALVNQWSSDTVRVAARPDHVWSRSDFGNESTRQRLRW
jgi:hypothetical protein